MDIDGLSMVVQQSLEQTPCAGSAFVFCNRANKCGRCGGRPKAMNKQKLKHVEALLKDTENYPFVGDVNDQLHIGRTAFYRYFPPGCIKQLRNEHADNSQE